MTRAPDTLFADISQFIRQSNEMLEKGELVQLAGLDNRIEILCKEVLALSDDQRKEHAAKLQQLFDELKTLGESMAAVRDTLSGEMQGLAKHKKANTAYRVAEASDRKKPDEK